MKRRTNSRTESSPKGCDTFIIYPPTTPKEGEKQKIARYAAATHDLGAMLQCTYISIPQTINTHSVLLSQIEWMWGCENGANEHGGVTGNEAVWTHVPEESEKLLLFGSSWA
jgi:hypothetical protein